MNDEVVQWFWKCIRSWPAERKSRLLQFTTGTSRIPVNGFKDLQGSDGPRRFTIEKSGDPSQLPKSHTCFNRLDLPPYKDYASLEQKLTLAVECVHLFFHLRHIVYLSFQQGDSWFRARIRMGLGFVVLYYSSLSPCFAVYNQHLVKSLSFYLSILPFCSTYAVSIVYILPCIGINIIVVAFGEPIADCLS